MLAPILFSTTNIAKLLQARLVLGWSGFEVQRLETHRRAYIEPYGLPRQKFLSAGLKEVVSRAAPNRLVFIEDTTACFPALSHGGAEYPGQETKEWFARTSHEDLLMELESAGGNRRVVVRSDIALHVPGLPAPVFLSATTEGNVVKRLESIARNDLYPWLGQLDFSSWFVPTGASKVLAGMQLEESLAYDFRAKALSQLAQRLQEYTAVVNLPVGALRKKESKQIDDVSQEPLFDLGGSDFVLVVIGPMASGKTTVGHYLQLHRQFVHIEGSRSLGETAAKYHIDGIPSFEMADSLFRNYGYDVVEREIVIPMIQQESRPVVYTGCRTIEGIETLKEAAHELNMSLAVVYISSPSSVRLSRAVERRREGMTVDPLKFEHFSDRDEAYGTGLLGPYIADMEISNRRDLNSFLGSIQEMADLLRSGNPLSYPSRRVRLASRINECSTPDEVKDLIRRFAKGSLPTNLLTEAGLSRRGETFLKLVRGRQG